jgi:hypothetical protein
MSATKSLLARIMASFRIHPAGVRPLFEAHLQGVAFAANVLIIRIMMLPGVHLVGVALPFVGPLTRGSANCRDLGGPRMCHH